MRPILLLAIATAMLPAVAFGQGIDAAGLMTNGRPTDARADAMGGGDAAMPGDTRNMLQSPAALVDMKGLELYYRFATPYSFLSSATFTHLALAYRISDRFAIGVRYDDDQLDLGKSGLSFGDFIDPRRGFVYATGPTQDRYQTLAGTIAFKVHGGFSLGASLENIDVSGYKVPLTYASFGIRQRVELPAHGVWRQAVVASVNCTNGTSASEALPYVAKEVTYSLPVITRTAVAYAVEFRKGWITDTLPSLRFIAHAQYDDDLTAMDNTAIRCGGELEVCGLIALRAGWFHQTIPSGAQYESYQKEFTYGFGIILPVQALTKGRVPISASIDYTALPQPATITTQDGAVVSNGIDYKDFQSIGVRVNIGLGQLCKKRSKVEGS